MVLFNHHTLQVRGRKLAEAASRVNEMLYKANMAIGNAARSGKLQDMLGSIELGAGYHKTTIVKGLIRVCIKG